MKVLVFTYITKNSFTVFQWILIYINSNSVGKNVGATEKLLQKNWFISKFKQNRENDSSSFILENINAI